MTTDEIADRINKGTISIPEIAAHYKVGNTEVEYWFAIADHLHKEALAGAPRLAGLSLNDMRMAVVTMEGDIAHV